MQPPIHVHARTLATTLKTWNQLIHSSTRSGFYVETLNLYSAMHASNVHGDHLTLPFVAKSCSKLRSPFDGRKVHCHSILLGFDVDVFVQTSFLNMYAKCSSLGDSRKVFDEMPMRNLVTWNSMIGAYSCSSQIYESFKLFNSMRNVCVCPSASTCVSLISGCTEEAIWHGFSIYGYGIKLGLSLDLQVSNSIIAMLSKFGLIREARSIFDSMAERSVVTWTAIMSGYVKIGDYAEVFVLFNETCRNKINIDSIMVLNLIVACALSGELSVASSVHSLLIKRGFHRGGIVPAALVNLYAKCDDLRSARAVFDFSEEKSVSLWTSIITGYVRSGFLDEALKLYEYLLSTAIRPNEVTMTTIISACAHFGTVGIGAKLEERIKSNKFGSDLRVQTALVQMYCKSGNIERAKEIFDEVHYRDLTLWSTMINGYACHGMGNEALELFEQMKSDSKIQPDGVLFTNVLLACSHSGLIEEGLVCFDSMRRDYGIEPTIEHYFCIIDLLGRAGKFDLASKIVERMLVEARSNAFANTDQVSVELESQDAGPYVMMANRYASTGNWSKASSIRELMEKRGLIKEAGWTKIELCC